MDQHAIAQAQAADGCGAAVDAGRGVAGDLVDQHPAGGADAAATQTDRTGQRLDTVAAVGRDGHTVRSLDPGTAIDQRRGCRTNHADRDRALHAHLQGGTHTDGHGANLSIARGAHFDVASVDQTGAGARKLGTHLGCNPVDRDGGAHSQAATCKIARQRLDLCGVRGLDL